MPVSQNLKYWMDVRGVTTAGLAESSGIPDSTITKIRTGKTQSPGMETLKCLAKALNISINDLTDLPVSDEEEIRNLLPKKMDGVSEEVLHSFLSTLRNQRLAYERTTLELRRDRNFWRKFAVVCIGCVIPVVITILIIDLVLYWDLSHPGEGNILLNYALEHYNIS